MQKQILLTALLATAFGINAVSIQQLIDEGRCPRVTAASFGGESLNLAMLDIDDLTGLRNIPGIDYVTELNLFHNKIINIQGFFDNLPNLLSINLAQNQIRSIDHCFDSCPNLKQINVSSNSLESLNSANIMRLPSLKRLDVSENFLILSQEKKQMLSTKCKFNYGTQREQPELDFSF